MSEKKYYPHPSNVFKAFERPFEDVQCVILGQDPYHTPGMADGLAFSCMPGAKVTPPSLKNIFDNIEVTLGYKNSRTDLSPWADKGILLLNTCLTVEQGKPLSHRMMGWQALSFSVVRAVVDSAEENETRIIPFLLMGKEAHAYSAIISNYEGERKLGDKYWSRREKAYAELTSHPSPFSYHKHMKNSRIFARAADFMERSYRIWKT